MERTLSAWGAGKIQGNWFSPGIYDFPSSAILCCFAYFDNPNLNQSTSCLSLLVSLLLRRSTFLPTTVAGQSGFSMVPVRCCCGWLRAQPVYPGLGIVEHTFGPPSYLSFHSGLQSPQPPWKFPAVRLWNGSFPIQKTRITIHHDFIFKRGPVLNHRYYPLPVEFENQIHS